VQLISDAIITARGTNHFRRWRQNSKARLTSNLWAACWRLRF